MLGVASRLLVCTAVLVVPPLQAADHPLDPLSYQEVWRVLEILRDEGRLDGETRFSQLTLQEPAKDEVLAWRPGADMPRAAYAVVRQGAEAFEAVVDLAAAEVASWSLLEGGATQLDP